MQIAAHAIALGAVLVTNDKTFHQVPDLRITAPAAQQLMVALLHVSVGRAKLIEREALSDFLRRLNESDNPAETFATKH